MAEGRVKNAFATAAHQQRVEQFKRERTIVLQAESSMHCETHKTLRSSVKSTTRLLLAASVVTVSVAVAQVSSRPLDTVHYGLAPTSRSRNQTAPNSIGRCRQTSSHMCAHWPVRVRCSMQQMRASSEAHCLL